MKNATLVLVVALALILSGVGKVEASFLYSTPAGSTTGGGLVDAEASFTLSNDSITLTLTNLFQNPRAVSQLISALTFTVSGASGPSSLNTSNSGDISTINSDGTYTTGAPDSLASWTASKAGTSINLTTLGAGTPNILIIGPDDAGGFTHLGFYDNANKSITGDSHNPSVLGSATFTITIPGVTSSSTLSGVTFQFGTDAGRNLVAGVPTTIAVPEPATLTMLGIGIACMAGYGWRRRKQSVPA